MPFLKPPNLQNQAHIKQNVLEKTLFVLPQNDGEAIRSLDILEAVKAPWVHRSLQSWGAVLDREVLPREVLSKVDRVVTFELPAKVPEKGELCCEERLKLQGVDLKIIDHHRYGWVDRSSSQSSLEQLCADIGWKLDRVDMGIAVNDRSYIGGLYEAGYTTDEVVEIRYYDLKAQGHHMGEILDLRKKAQLWIQDHHAEKGFWLLEHLTFDKKWIMQELALNAQKNDVHALERQPHKMSFSGSPEVVAALNALKPKDWGYKGRYTCYSGGDPQTSQYWTLRGMKPLGKLLSEKIFATVTDILKKEVADER
ncbi:MAG: hypothetical protein AB8C84_00570 [Oligoflexales bacterium]